MDSSIKPFRPLTREDVASVLDIKIRTVDSWAESGVLPPKVPIEGKVYWHPDVFYGWLDAVLRSSPPELQVAPAPKVPSAGDSQGEGGSEEGDPKPLSPANSGPAHDDRVSTQRSRRSTPRPNANLNARLQGRDQAALRRILG